MCNVLRIPLGYLSIVFIVIFKVQVYCDQCVKMTRNEPVVAVVGVVVTVLTVLTVGVVNGVVVAVVAVEAADVVSVDSGAVVEVIVLSAKHAKT